MSNIEWTDTTWNPVVGCTKVSSGCANCYAETMSNRLAGMARKDRADGKDPGRKLHHLHVINDKGRFNGTVRTVPEVLGEPLKWRTPRRVFVNSMSDLFHRDVPFAYIDCVFAVMALCPQHTFQILTKRPERMAEYLRSVAHERKGEIAVQVFGWAATRKLSDGWANSLNVWPLPNVWLGTSCEDQKAADERIPHLLRCPAAVRFLSCEPLLGPISLDAHCPPDYAAHRRSDRISWVIVGGESGHGARACCSSWVRGLVQQCRAAGVPVFVKQMGSKALLTENHTQMCLARVEMGGNGKRGNPDEWPADLRVREFPSAQRAPGEVER